jgi:hypothetical protein
VDSDSETHPGKVLRIDRTPEDITDDCYFIYFEEGGEGGGRLVEKTANTPGVGDGRNARTIAYIGGFDIAYTDETRSGVQIEVRGTAEDGGDHPLRAVVSLRARLD